MTPRMSQRALFVLAVSAMLMIAAVFAAASAGPLEIRTFPTGRYVSGGVGADEQAEMERLRSQFNLRILTAQRRTGLFVADAEVRIIRGSEIVLETKMDGPLLLVQLPAGHYRVHVTYEGKSLERDAHILTGEGRELYLYWD